MASWTQSFTLLVLKRDQRTSEISLHTIHPLSGHQRYMHSVPGCPSAPAVRKLKNGRPHGTPLGFSTTLSHPDALKALVVHASFPYWFFGANRGVLPLENPFILYTSLPYLEPASQNQVGCVEVFSNLMQKPGW